MTIIDDDGFLFGRINIVDVLVVLFIFALIVAGLVLLGVGQSTPTSEYTVTMLVNNTEKPAAHSITTDHATEDMQVTRVAHSYHETEVTLRMELVKRENNQLYLPTNTERVIIGKHLTVDLNTIIFRGLVVALSPVEHTPPTPQTPQ